jgi:DNA-binding protein HU-beta
VSRFGATLKGGSIMTRKLLLDALAKDGLSTKDANAVIGTVVTTITKELKKAQKFTLTGFGTFAVSKRAARKGRNPKTGEPIKIKASKGVRFKAGATLKAGV